MRPELFRAQETVGDRAHRLARFAQDLSREVLRPLAATIKDAKPEQATRIELWANNIEQDPEKLARDGEKILASLRRGLEKVPSEDASDMASKIQTYETGLRGFSEKN